MKPTDDDSSALGEGHTHYHVTCIAHYPIRDRSLSHVFISPLNRCDSAVIRDGNMFTEFLVFEIDQTHDSLVELRLN